MLLVQPTVKAQPAPPTLQLLGELDIPTLSLQADGTTVGGLSGVTYDAKRDVYYVISDDKGDFGPARFYTLKIDIGLDGIHDVRVIGTTVLDSDADAPGIQPYADSDSDTEEIVLLPDDTLLISSERDRNLVPWVRHFALDGTLMGELALPDMFLPASSPGPDGRPVQTRGVRNNLAFEGVTLAPDEDALYLINEEALAQDGPISSPAAGTQVRLSRFEFDAASATATLSRQHVYRTEPIFASPFPDNQFADNGVSSLLWIRDVLPQFDFLAMERSFVTGIGNKVAIYGVQVGDADEVSSLAALPQPFAGRTVSKTLLVDIGSLGVMPDNLEGLVVGPGLPDGRHAVIVLSDDNFSPVQTNQFLLFAI
jgi:3-phytase